MPTLTSDVSGYWNSKDIVVPAGTNVEDVTVQLPILPKRPTDEIKLAFSIDGEMPPKHVWVVRQALEAAGVVL